MRDSVRDRAHGNTEIETEGNGKPAVARSAGRLEVHLEIGLPDASGRAQILQIHTAAMAAAGLLAADVDLLALARECRNFSGAELAGLVRPAKFSSLKIKIKVLQI